MVFDPLTKQAFLFDITNHDQYNNSKYEPK